MSDDLDYAGDMKQQIAAIAGDVQSAIVKQGQEIVRLRAENDRLRKALEFYGDERMWSEGSEVAYFCGEDGEQEASAFVTYAYQDSGRTAREALGGNDGK